MQKLTLLTFSKGSNHKTYFLITKIALLGMTFFGAVRTADLAWAMGDIGVEQWLG